MALQSFDATNAAKQMERIIIYGRAGFGKTRLGLSLSPRFGEILYYAADGGSEFLPSIGDAKKNRIHVIKPDASNPIQNFQEFCMRDWRGVYPKVQTIVIDTYSMIAQDSLQYSANTGAVTSESHYKVGDPNLGGQVIPNRGDFRAIASLSRGYLKNLFEHQSHYHIILICHEDSKPVEGGKTIGGPAHVGWEMTEELPARFGTVIRLIREPLLIPGRDVPEVKVIAVTEGDGQYISKIRTKNEKDENPIARVPLDRDPSSYWTEKYDPAVLSTEEESK